MTFKHFRRAAWLACVAALAAGAATAGQLDQIRESRQIVIAHREGLVPFSYVAGDDKKPLGYAVEICQKIAEAVRKELKLPALEVRYLPVTGATRIPTIVEGKAAMECGSTTNTAARRQQVDFTITHFIAASRFLTRSSTPGSTVGDLAGKTVVSTAGTTNIETLRRLDREQGLKMKIVEARDHAEAFSMVERAAADAFAMDDVLLYSLRATSGKPSDFQVIGKPMTIEPYAMVLPKGDAEFKRVVDAEMRRLIQSGEIYELYRKWFQTPIPPKGINLELPVSSILRDSFRYPSDKVGDGI
ncbi:amino acid ABC transporter substrate-binding protein [Xylophilus ampelinus]|uniref:Amino acid ABC transporter substrate-binding protein (PAAT family) n=1 Tax=Xylophilus ampelinus TaxID=54067 RepID=A0A318SCF1_9BURK|nr:amino acid ABC transporter substrate-binding protein [Xylophilus ampelinus]MCS4511567.1 amino acid ABC transporter substrate-binding protein [Xylophilus ampelinus]PYE74262.1 amino acid ABC transporter substrate-binding protein (PAAT family) [Xylophilus ampelinus]